MMSSKKIFIAVTCALLAAVCSGPARAQQTTAVAPPAGPAAAAAVGITPISIDAKVKRGTTYTQTYTLSNNTPARMRFRCTVSDYWYDEQNRRVTDKPGTLPRSASAWVQLTPSEVVVEPHSSASVRAVVSVPLSAAGGYYTMPVFEATTDDASAVYTTGSGGTTATASIGFRFRGLMMLTTEDAAEYNVEIMDGAVKAPTASAPLELSLDVRNRSTTHARVRGSFVILDSSGAPAGRGRIQEKRFMPGQRGDYKAEWAGTLTAGRYTAVVTLSYDRAGAEPATLVYELPFEARDISATAASR